MAIILPQGFSNWFLGAMVCTLLLILNWMNSRSKKSNKKFPPPFPLGLLVIFKAFDPNINCQRVVAELGQKNPVQFFQWPWPKIRVLFLNDYELSLRCFTNNVFNGRPENEFLEDMEICRYGLATVSGPDWVEQRRFTLRTLKDIGMGTKSMEDLMEQEVDYLLQTFNLAAEDGKPISPNDLFKIPILNTLWVFVTGERFSQSNPAVTKMLYSVYESNAEMYSFPLGYFVITQRGHLFTKWAKKIGLILPFENKLGRFVMAVDNLYNYCKEMITQRQKMLADGYPATCFMDAQILEVEKTTDEKSSLYKEKGMKNLVFNMIDFIIAGGDSASNLIAWAMLHLIRNPKEQEKIQDEIDRVVGGKKPTLQDRPNLPYCTAFLYEVMRVTPVGIFSVPRRTMDDTEVDGYFVPKNTTVMLNIATIHADKKLWGDPQVFRPDRFLSADGTKIENHEAMVSFGMGKRRCPGIRQGLDTLFLFLMGICHKFTVKNDPALNELPTLTPTLSMLLIAKKFSMVVETRNN